MIPFVSWAATTAESFGIALIIRIWRQWIAISASALLFLFGMAMTISFGVKVPLDYSVFSACGALLPVRTTSQAKGPHLSAENINKSLTAEN